MKEREGVVSLALSSRSWRPATDQQTDRIVPLCDKHTPRFAGRAQTSATTRATTYRCSVCGARYDIVETL